jgi:DNA-binding response OmpR family regulator
MKHESFVAFRRCPTDNRYIFLIDQICPNSIFQVRPTMSDIQKTIVVIEDDRDISTTIQSVLNGAGYKVFAANNGQDGRRLIQSQKPDLVLTDMMMPRMGGFPVLEFLAEMADAPPVIMMTANEGSRHKAYAEMLGVVDYLRKPFAMEVMLESIARAISVRSQE